MGLHVAVSRLVRDIIFSILLDLLMIVNPSLVTGRRPMMWMWEKCCWAHFVTSLLMQGHSTMSVIDKDTSIQWEVLHFYLKEKEDILTVIEAQLYYFINAADKIK